MGHRMWNHQHNSLLGSACRSNMDFHRIETAPSATPEAKNLATEIRRLQSLLYTELKTHRVEPDGSTKTFKE